MFLFSKNLNALQRSSWPQTESSKAVSRAVRSLIMVPEIIEAMILQKKYSRAAIR